MILLDLESGGVFAGGVLELPDPVLHTGVRAVAGFQERQLPDAGVGGHRLVAVAVPVPAACSFSECTSIRVASRSITT